MAWGHDLHTKGVDVKYPMKYGRDTSSRLTVNEIIKGLARLVLDDKEDSEIADYIDQEFLYGAWGFLTDRIETYSEGNLELGTYHPMFTADIRGLVLAAFKHGHALGKHGSLDESHM